MDSAKLILTEPVLPPTPLDNFNAISLSSRIAKGQPSRIEQVSQEKQKQVAKDFESILLHKLLEQMKSTILDCGFDEHGGGEQVRGIFWLYLAHDIANKGGLGLSKDIYEFLTNPAPIVHPREEQTGCKVEPHNSGSIGAGTTESLDKNV